MKESTDDPHMPDSSSSSSSSSPDTDHPAHRSQLFKRPPRFKQQRPQDLSDFQEDAGVPGSEGSSSHDTSSLPFASSTRRSAITKHSQDTHYTTDSNQRQEMLPNNRFRNTHSSRQDSGDNQFHAIMGKEPLVIIPASERDVPVQLSAPRIPTPAQANYRAELGKPIVLSRRGQDRRKNRVRERLVWAAASATSMVGEKKTMTSLGLTDIDASISQSALEEALLSNMQHGRMSTLSRMSRYL
jgi:hypothetical protein